MSPREIALLREALDLPEAERATFVERRCADDPARCARLLDLIALDAEGDALLDGGVDTLLADAFAGDEVGTAPMADRRGEEIGPWRILRHLAEGGMGSVWLAERVDGEFTQTVALKTVKPGMDSAAVLRAFQREREVLARLQHPQIAHLIDGGVDASVRPWFAMRYMEGEPLDAWLGRAPPLRARLALFASLCRVVAHAHRQLVVHQDIKPGNVIVQADGTPCLLDFGIGRILHGDSRDGTQTVQRFASPAYAAPEQITGGAISTATDVYALGAILFELLTGRRYSAMHRGGDATTRPSHAVDAAGDAAAVALPAAQLRGDLDAIAARALAVDPARRYGGADLLADDIDRYLVGWPVTARPDGELYRLSKWVRRNRLAAAALFAAVLALGIGLVVSLQQTRVAQQESQRASAIKDYMIGLFEAGRVEAGGAEVLDQRVIDLLDARSLRLKDELAHLPEVRDEVYATLVEIYSSFNRRGHVHTLALAQERVEQAELAFGKNDPRVAPALVLLAGVRINYGEMKPVPALLDRAQALLDASGGHRSLTQAQTWQWRGAYIDKQDEERSAEAATWLEKAIALLDARFPGADERIIARIQLAEALDGRSDPERAIALIEEIRRTAVELHGPENTYVLQADLLEPRLLLALDRPEESLIATRRLMPQLERLRGPGHFDGFVLRYRELEALLGLGRIDEADAVWQASDAQRREFLPDVAVLAEAFQKVRQQIDAARAQGSAAPDASQ